MATDRHLSTPPPNLQPMNLGDILDAIFRLYRNNFLLFLGIIVLLQIPVMIGQGIITAQFGLGYASELELWTQALLRFDPASDSFSDINLPLDNTIAFFSLLIFLSMVDGIIVRPLMTGAFANAISRRYLDQSVSLVQAYSFGFSRVITLIAAQFLIVLFLSFIFAVLYGLFILAIVALVMGVSGQDGGASVVGIILTIGGAFTALFVLIVASLFFWVRFLFVPYAVVLENRGITQSITRSWNLVSGSFWRTLGIMLLITIMVAIITFVPAFILGMGVGVITVVTQNAALSQIFNVLVNYATNMLTMPLSLIGMTLLYYDLRVRKEGYDMELALQQPTGTLSPP
jgi:hypothetical protein